MMKTFETRRSGGAEEKPGPLFNGRSGHLKSRNQWKIFNYQITNLLNYQIPPLPPFLCVSRFSDWVLI